MIMLDYIPRGVREEIYECCDCGGAYPESDLGRFLHRVGRERVCTMCRIKRSGQAGGAEA